MRSGGARAALFVVDAFVALTAVGGGIALAAGPQANRFLVEMPRGSPFGSHVVPGLIPAAVAGVVMMGWIFGGVLHLNGAVGPVMEVLGMTVGGLQ